MTYDEPEPEKKSWFSSPFNDSAERIAGFVADVFRENLEPSGARVRPSPSDNMSLTHVKCTPKTSVNVSLKPR